ncbi:GNAT family N-acetyltransferase [Verrucosispora sp. WMMA2044]|uniref:GNAT family N-acetyltransferase n=1 Tax=Verrucosispora sp. WMMA2044 TaxID=3016419 RepID=UPI00248CCC3C|nr:GNAT family N-acetyltransferase [Verrucosispora sp. WMMA2044]WBB48502.1 GNAT family N-acetyltransferase [Verrucosispora sp. WMMA2044]
MGKRSSRSRRREPIRRPIPAARLSASAGTDLTEQHLVDGWRVRDKVRVRLARGADMATVGRLSALAGVHLEEAVADAVEAGVGGTALRAGLNGGPDKFMRHMAETFIGPGAMDLRRLLPPTTLVLVAEHDEYGVIGALVAYPPGGVIQQLVEHHRRIGLTGEQLSQLVMAGVMWIVRVKAIAVDEAMRGHGIGSTLLYRCQQMYARCGYMITYGQMADSPALERFYRNHSFEVLERDSGFDPWVVLGVHTEIRPDPGERTFVRYQEAGRDRRRPGRVPVPRGGRTQFDPGTLALSDDHLPSLLMHGSGELLAIQFLPLLWVKMAEGQRANACLDACAQLRHAYQQFGIRAEIVPVGVVIHYPDGSRTRYATDEPRWHDDATLVGHTVLLLPDHGRLVDPTIEQVPEIRKLRQGPVIGRLPEQSRHALYDGGTGFAVQRAGLLIEYQPVRPEHRDRLLSGPLLTRNDAEYRRSAINLAAMAVQAFRDAGAVDRIQQTTAFPRLTALLDVIGDAVMGADESTGDVLIHLPGGPVRLDQVPVPGSGLGGQQ